jgi:hypothetical protein
MVKTHPKVSHILRSCTFYSVFFFLSFSLFLTPVYRVNFFAYFLYTLKLKIHPFDQMLRKEVPENAKYRSINFYRN